MSQVEDTIKSNNEALNIYWTKRQKFYVRVVKPALDFFFAVLGLILLSPLFLIIAFAIKIDSKGPVFFKQERVGKNGQIFNIYKFRTMVNGAINKGSGIRTGEGDSRITKIGEIVRKNSLDELPQMFNILKGEMSVIGPRPTLEYQVKRYNETQKKRLSVKPGLTGLAQVNGRNNLAWSEKIKYDISYAYNYSFLYDFKIILKTLFVLLKADNIDFNKDDYINKE